MSWKAPPVPSHLLDGARLLLCALGGIWLLFGGISLWRLDTAEMSSVTLVAVGIMMLGNGAAYGMAAWATGRWRHAFWPVLALLLLNLLLTVTDQVGFFDWATLGLNLLVLALLLVARRVPPPA